MTKADNVEQKGHGGSSTHQSPQVALGVHALVVFQEQLLRFDEGKRKKKKNRAKGRVREARRLRNDAGQRSR